MVLRQRPFSQALGMLEHSSMSAPRTPPHAWDYKPNNIIIQNNNSNRNNALGKLECLSMSAPRPTPHTWWYKLSNMTIIQNNNSNRNNGIKNDNTEQTDLWHCVLIWTHWYIYMPINCMSHGNLYLTRRKCKVDTESYPLIMQLAQRCLTCNIIVHLQTAV